MTPNQKAFLGMTAISELGRDLIAASDNGYNVLVGSTAKRPLLFHDYSKHPNILNPVMHSTAAGRYQLLGKYYEPYRKLLGLPDFSPASQDAIALQQIKERSAWPDIEAGYLDDAIAKTNNIWASFYGSPYGQHTNTLDFLYQAFEDCGGTTHE